MQLTVAAVEREQLVVRAALDDLAALRAPGSGRRCGSSTADARSRTSCGRGAASAAPSWIFASLSLSRLDVASSRIRMRGSARIARAIATRWRWPPDSRMPRSPTTVSYLSLNSSMNSSQCAMRLASRDLLAASRADCRSGCSRQSCRRTGSCPAGRCRAASDSRRSRSVPRSRPSMQDASRRRAVERHHQADERALARAARADQRGRRSRPAPRTTRPSAPACSACTRTTRCRSSTVPRTSSDRPARRVVRVLGRASA